jgi:hypothetical protein
MAGWGIGLGSFVGGMQQGYGLGQSIQSNRTANQMRQIQLQDMQRTEAQKQELDAIGSQGKADFDKAVAQGQADPQHPDEWFSQNYAPKMENFFLSKGDVESAAKWNKWSNDTTTKKQIRAMGSVVGRLYDGANTGDYSGLESEMGNFFKTLPADMRKRVGSFDGLRAETDENGKFIATASFTDTGGKEHIYTWDSPDALRQTIEGWANPSALYAETMKDEAAAKKYKADLGEYAAKKGIDLRAAAAERAAGLKGKTPQERAAAAQEVLTKANLDGKAPTVEEIAKYLQDQDAAAARIAPGISAPGATPVGTTAQPSAPAPAAAQPSTPATAPKIIVNQKAAQAVDATGKPLPLPSTPSADAASITAPPPASAPSQPAAPSPPPPSAGQGIATGIGLPAVLARVAPQVAPTGVAVAQQAPGLGAAPVPAAAAIAPGKGQPVYVATPQAPNGMLKQGNVDLSKRPVVKNPDGTISTVRSITVTLPDGKAVLIPTVVGGRVVSNQEAIQHFKQTGEHLGIFKDETAADQYANALHEQQAQAYAPQGR